MFETAAESAFNPPNALRAPFYRGPERRHSTTSIARWLSLMLDEIDFGMLLLSDVGEVMHVNHAARADFDEGHPLLLRGRRLVARDAQDLARLHDALASASQRNLRRLLSLGEGEQRVNIAVIPLGNRATLVSLAKRHLSERISVQCFARLHNLTPAETRVLESLCEGLDPREIAELNVVGLATVRTQIGSVRAKTGADNIRDLVRQVAKLPPMVNAIRS